MSEKKSGFVGSAVRIIGESAGSNRIKHQAPVGSAVLALIQREPLDFASCYRFDRDLHP
jgi:hypothetical protein